MQCSRDLGIGFNGIGFWLAAERYRNGIGFAALAERYSGIGCPAATGTVWNGIGNSTLVGGNSACAAQCGTGRLASCPYRYTPASPAAPIPERGYHRASTCRPAQAGHGRDALTCCVSERERRRKRTQKCEKSTGMLESSLAPQRAR